MVTAGMVEHSKNFKEVWKNITGYSEKDLNNRKMEALAAEVMYLEGVIEILGAENILNRHTAAQEAAKQKKKTVDKQVTV